MIQLRRFVYHDMGTANNTKRGTCKAVRVMYTPKVFKLCFVGEEYFREKGRICGSAKLMCIVPIYTTLSR